MIKKPKLLKGRRTPLVNKITMSKRREATIPRCAVGCEVGGLKNRTFY